MRWLWAKQQYEARGMFPLHPVPHLTFVYRTFAAWISIYSLMPKEKKADLGAQFASYYTPEENVDKPLPPSIIEAVRDERRKDYAAIARECVLITTFFVSPD